jgi:predicted PurR-regulated permease PerM
MLDRKPFDFAAVRITQVPALIGIAFGLLIFWFVGEVFLVAFGGLLFAVFLSALAEWTSAHLHVSYRWSLAICGLILLALCGATGYFIGARIAEQMSQMLTLLPQSIDQVRHWAGQYVKTSWVDSASPFVFGEITGMASHTFRFVVDVVIMILIGVYCAVEPEFYRDGLARLFPLDKRARAIEVMSKVTCDLRWWILGKLIAMAAVAILIGLAMWLVGMPLALTFGLLAGLLEFVPIVGPVFWLLPAILVAVLQGWNEVFNVFVVYCGLHLLESYILIPVVQRRAVQLAPAITILSIMFMTLTQGVLGVLTAAPLAVTAIALIKTLYVEDFLGDYSANDLPNRGSADHPAKGAKGNELIPTAPP